jgi:pilus assembly protein CpaE
VCNLTLPILRNTKRLLEILAHLNYPIDNINIIVNRYEKHTEVSVKDLEEVLRHKASWLIPNDYATTTNAINKGQPLASIANRADVTKSFRKFAQSLMAEEDKDNKPSFFSRLFKSH